MKRNLILKLEKDILKHKRLYYEGHPEISDLEFDKLEDQLRDIDPENPVLSMVGSDNFTGEKVKHDSKMLSLNKTYKLDELERWRNNHEVISMHKIDGTSCSLIYENGHLVLAKTRGDGSFVDNITEKIKWVETVPKTIDSKDKVEIRGEVFCIEEKFFHLSEEMVALKLEKPTSQRNIVAGLLGRKENIFLCKYLDFFAFDVLSNELKFKKENEKFKFMEGENFTIPEVELHKSKKSLESVTKSTEEFMSGGDYLVDGVVFFVNDISQHDEMGTTAHHPKYKIAFKYQGETKKTIIEEIVWSVSRNGILTPVANVKSVNLSGANITRVTLHNYGMVRQFDIKKGDEIEITRSGEVIPKFISVVKPSKNKFSVPSRCPSCTEKIEEVDIRLICNNPECPAQVHETILNFIQKIGIDDLSTKRLEELINAGFVSSIVDLYTLNEEDLMTLDKVKEKLASKVVSNIQASKKVNLVTFLSALGISGGAYNKCEKVVENGFDSIGKILKIKKDDLLKIESFAEKSANEFYKSLKSKFPLIEALVDVGIKPEYEQMSGKLSGMKICITGSLSDKRSNIEKKIRESGGICVKSVSKETNYLLTNDTESSSSKFVKAKKLGIPIISENDFNAML